MKLKVKKLHPEAKLPVYSTLGAACFDVSTVGLEYPIMLSNSERTFVFRTGLAFEVPEGHVMLAFSRSGQGFKFDTRLANCVGVIDEDYRGELMVKLTYDGDSYVDVQNGDRIAQCMVIPVAQCALEEVEELSTTIRGVSGIGSTGK